MPRVERTGIYRDANGSALFLRKDRLVGEDVAANYVLDEDAVLSPVRQAIADRDHEPRSFVGAPLGAEVVSVASDNASYPAPTEVAEESAPAPVKPTRRQSKRKVETPEDGAPPIETPEDQAPAAIETASGESDSDGDGKSDAAESDEEAA